MRKGGTGTGTVGIKQEQGEEDEMNNKGTGGVEKDSQDCNNRKSEAGKGNRRKTRTGKWGKSEE